MPPSAHPAVIPTENPATIPTEGPFIVDTALNEVVYVNHIEAVTPNDNAMDSAVVAVLVALGVLAAICMVILVVLLVRNRVGKQENEWLPPQSTAMHIGVPSASSNVSRSMSAYAVRQRPQIPKEAANAVDVEEDKPRKEGVIERAASRWLSTADPGNVDPGNINMDEEEEKVPLPPPPPRNRVHRDEVKEDEEEVMLPPH